MNFHADYGGQIQYIIFLKNLAMAGGLLGKIPGATDVPGLAREQVFVACHLSHSIQG
jgi:hypothetical protein